eukprot:CAMPEP_0172315022 /NCGR_PEP_ID=MMETSP1058-20130122/23885_1 /TAXON_ID=83371 /ORGANISM="Detonula confervacea, Strain CCMP 353" /LENGTH=35 /DNA_ID= /DNA_START= /DNA_END= /DNA_ORIENTATION=
MPPATSVFKYDVGASFMAAGNLSPMISTYPSSDDL